MGDLADQLLVRVGFCARGSVVSRNSPRYARVVLRWWTPLICRGAPLSTAARIFSRAAHAGGGGQRRPEAVPPGTGAQRRPLRTAVGKRYASHDGMGQPRAADLGAAGTLAIGAGGASYPRIASGRRSLRPRALPGPGRAVTAQRRGARGRPGLSRCSGRTSGPAT
jgi:hypothetical protein